MHNVKIPKGKGLAPNTVLPPASKLSTMFKKVAAMKAKPKPATGKDKSKVTTATP